MAQVNFWTPIVNHGNNWVAAADQLFYFGCEKAYLIDFPKHSYKVKIEDKEALTILQIAWRVAILFTVIAPLFLLMIKAYDRWSNSYQILQTPPPSQANRETAAQPPAVAPAQAQIKSEKERVIIYMSLTGNPTHLGHMAAVATAIDVLVKKEMEVDHVRISLSDQGYHQGKVARSKGKKIALKQEEREYLLNGAIQEAARRNMFKNVLVCSWNDQDNGYADHPDSYARLVKEQELPVYLVAGADLCKAMNNWPSIKNAIIVSRESSSSDISAYANNIPDPSYQRLFVNSLYSEFINLSSSAIQEGRAALEPKELQTYFEQRKQAVTST